MKKKKTTVRKPKPKGIKGKSKPLVYGPIANPSGKKNPD